MQGDPRFGQPRAPYPYAPVAPQQHAQPQVTPPPPSTQPNAPRIAPYATYSPQPSQPAPSFMPHPPHPYGAPLPAQPMAPWAPANPAARFAQIAGNVPQPSGMPSVVAFGLSIVAVCVALVFDAIFLRVSIPGVGGYAWYLTTALSFAGAGFGGMKWTRASKTVAMTAVGFAAALYGAADLGLGLVLDHVTLNGALTLAIQGVVIALITGAGGVQRGSRAKSSASR